MQNSGLDKPQAGINIVRRNINKLKYADDTTLMADSEEEIKSLLIDEGEGGVWKGWLKTQHSKMRIMASGPITSWQIEGEKLETVAYFMFLGSIITVNSDCSHEIKTIAPWKKSYDKPRQCIKTY